MLKNYLKLALKVLLRRKFYTFISLFGISFTLLVLTVATAMMDHLFAPHPPEKRMDRLLAVSSMRLKGPRGSWGSSPGYSFLDRYVRTLPGVEAVTLTTSERAASYFGGQKIESSLMRTDGQFWKIFDFDFVEGGPFLPADEEQGNFVAVINEASRERFFDGAPAVGREVTLDGQTFRVVGVVANVSLARRMTYADVWVPIATSPSTNYRHRFMGGFNGIILARNRGDLKRIQQEFDSSVGTVELPDPTRYDTLLTSADTLFEKASREMFGAESGPSHAGRLRALIVGVTLLFMLLPAVNLMNINLSRILERASEIGVRKAFGASSRVLVGQFVVENVVLTLVGGLIGFALSGLALSALNRSGLIPYADFSLNLRVFGWGLLIALAFGLLSGVYPAWKMSRLHPVQALRGGRS